MMTLIAALALAQNARELLETIEAAAEKAASLKVDVEIQGSGAHGAFKGGGTAAFKLGRRARVTLRYDVGGTAVGAWMVSDGKGVLTGEPPLRSLAPARPATGFVRAGAVLLSQPGGNLAAGFDWGGLELRNLQAAGGVVSYEFTLLDATYTVKLHHDAERPTKRVVTFTAGKRTGEYTENYPSWTPGADVPDASFKLERP